MTAPGEIAQPHDVDHFWSQLAASRARPTDAEVAEMATWSTHFPQGTKVIITPVSGPSWRGVIEDWTEPGSGRPMAMVRPSKGRSQDATMLVLPSFVGHVSGCDTCRARTPRRRRG